MKYDLKRDLNYLNNFKICENIPSYDYHLKYNIIKYLRANSSNGYVSGKLDVNII